MGASIPKQFLELNGRPILMHTMDRFFEYDPAIEMILVLPENQLVLWKDLCLKHHFTKKHHLVTGGEERFHSVQNGLAKITGDLVAVHDAVRPLVTKAVIEACFLAAAEKKAVVPVLPIKESIRKVDGQHSKSVLRSNYVTVQTPQCFSADVLKSSYQKSYEAAFTDDASVVESNGHEIALVDGNEENIKITTPTDLKWAELLLNHE